MAASKGTADEKVKSILAAHIRDADDFIETEVVVPRERMEDYYLGNKFGNEKPGRSQVVSLDVMEAIEWMMPSFMRIFHGNDEVVSFEPQEPGDEQFAEQATDYINYIYNRDNPGFEITESWLKDSLISRVAAVKWYWEEKTEYSDEYLENVSLDQLVAEAQAQGADPAEPFGPGAEVVEQTANADGTYNLHIRREKKIGKACVDSLPPGEFLIDRRAKRNPDSSHFCAHKRQRTRSELIKEGYDKDLVWKLPFDNDEVDDGAWDKEETRYGENDATGNDDSLRLVSIYECYVRIDRDGDGIAELRRITVAGQNAAYILADEEADDIPFASFSSIRLPHSTIGRCVADMAKDIQLIKSTLWRMMLDGLYTTVSPMAVAVENQVYMDTLLNRGPNSTIVVKSPGAVEFPQQPWAGAQAFPMVEYLDKVKEGRVGVSQTSAGLNPDLLSNQTLGAVSQVMAASRERVELIARAFAETGFKRMFRGLLRLVAKYQDRERVIRLRGSWTAMDPSKWNKDMDVTVSVGLGTGNKELMVGQLSQLLAMQKEVLMGGGLGGIVDPEKVYNTFKALVKAMGLPSVEPYFNQPQPPDPNAPPPPDPAMAEVQGKLQIEQQKLTIQTQANQAQAQSQIQAQAQKDQASAELERWKAEQEFALAERRQQAELIQQERKMELEAQQRIRELELEAGLREKEIAMNAQAQTNIKRPD